MCEKYECKLLLCWYPCPQPLPTTARITIGTFSPAGGRVRISRNHVDQLVHGQQQKINTDVDVDGTQAVYGGPHAETGHGIFRDWRVEATIRSEFRQKTGRTAENLLVIRHPDAVDEDPGIPFHFLSYRLVKGLAEANPPHERLLGRAR